MEYGLTESAAGRKPSDSAESTYKCALALNTPDRLLRPRLTCYWGRPSLIVSEIYHHFKRVQTESIWQLAKKLHTLRHSVVN